MQSRRFDFEGEGGHRLAGTLDLPNGPVRGCALFAHCFTCTRSSLAASRVSRALASLGFATLRFDFTGLGQSGGEFADSSFSGSVSDIGAAADAMRAAGTPVSLLVGHSLGGAAVLAAAGTIPEVAAVATIGAPADLAHVRRLFSDVDELLQRGEAEVSIGGRPFRMRRGFIDDLASHDQRSRIAGLRKPLLILHAPRDEVVGIENASQIFLAAKHPKSFVSLDDADHLLTRPRDAEFVANIIATWASRYLPDVSAPRTREQSGVVSVVETGEGNFQVEVTAGGVHFLADEPPEVGGLGSGPTPYDLVAAGLGACTAMTLRLYARGKSLPLDRVTVEVGHSRRPGQKPADLFSRRLQLEGALTGEQHQRLIEIAERCPVHRTLESGAAIETAEGGLDEKIVEKPGSNVAERVRLSESE
ncbi:MAG: OsmC family protein [Sphingomonas sp.]|nr:OsmC family protein [Sphingomonas sp.]